MSFLDRAVMSLESCRRRATQAAAGQREGRAGQRTDGRLGAPGRTWLSWSRLSYCERVGGEGVSLGVGRAETEDGGTCVVVERVAEGGEGGERLLGGRHCDGRGLRAEGGELGEGEQQLAGWLAAQEVEGRPVDHPPCRSIAPHRSIASVWLGGRSPGWPSVGACVVLRASRQPVCGRAGRATCARSLSLSHLSHPLPACLPLPAQPC